ncbi:FRG domain-containing protein [Guyparkeria halophila]|uniref:FRG domain-containing protein n=1 Tax=Guyparkeria halophila TaxID=47960 RepID=A0ABZ0YTM0_9GAMM|nr:FRG domain-containing protein [Guyparkeria halophila]WQH15520.1 FRG domain-containing protein [Guyparkeria halophila]
MNLLPDLLRNFDRGPTTIFRGHADSSWQAIPSIGRSFSGDWEKVLDKEKAILEEFKNRSIASLSVTPKSDIDWLCLMQHHGCPTRLLDYTLNPLIAIYFASDPTIEADGEVIIAKYKRSEASVPNDGLFDIEFPFAYHPPHITERIVGQAGCFVCSATPNRELVGSEQKGIKIPAGHKIRLRKELSVLGISYSSIFPGLDGICGDLRDTIESDLELEDLF